MPNQIAIRCMYDWLMKRFALAKVLQQKPIWIAKKFSRLRNKQARRQFTPVTVF